MLLYPPFEITPRLLAGVKVDGAWLAIDHVGNAGDRMVYRWYIDFPDGREFGEADLKSGTQGATTQEMFGSFLSFLSACGEAYRDQTSRGDAPTDTATLFPPAVAEWAYTHSDELDTLREEIEQAGAVLIEE